MAPKRQFDERYHSAREHLAGVKGAAKWIQDLAAEHLLKSEQPISKRPVKPAGEEES